MAAALALVTLCSERADADRLDTIERVRKSVVAVGTFDRLRTPQFEFLGTGFVVGDGTVVATNAHVLPVARDPRGGGKIAILLPGSVLDTLKSDVQAREASQLVIDGSVDLALLKIAGGPLQALRLGKSEAAREGQDVLFTGFPIGAVLGPFPVTHRGMISVITPIAIPQGRASELQPATVRRLATGSFPVFQLDATAYPGSSGSPVYDPESGDVLGIVNMVFVKGTKESILAQPSGITYAVPASHLQELLSRAR